jgi:hypothetical protein
MKFLIASRWENSGKSPFEETASVQNPRFSYSFSIESAYIEEISEAILGSEASGRLLRSQVSTWPN